MSWVAKPLPAKRTSTQPSSHHPGESRCGAGVDDRGTADGEDPAPRRVAHQRQRSALARLKAVRDPRHREGLRLLGGDLGGHEPEALGVRRRVPGSSTRTPLPADDDEVARPDPVHRHDPGSRGRTGPRRPRAHSPSRVDPSATQCPPMRTEVGRLVVE